jgi:hypothetical protein
VKIGIFFGTLAVYLIFSLIKKYNEDQQFILRSRASTGAGAYLRLVDGQVIMDTATSKNWKKGHKYMFKAGLEWRKVTKLYRGHKAARGETSIYCVGANKTCAPLHVLAAKSARPGQTSLQLGIEVADPKRLTPGGKLHEPEFKAFLDSSAMFKITPSIAGSDKAVSLECNGLFVRSRGTQLVLEDFNLLNDLDKDTVTAVAKQGFHAGTEDNQLAFEQNDVIVVVDQPKDSPEWTGYRLADSSKAQGRFPVRLVEPKKLKMLVAEFKDTGSFSIYSWKKLRKEVNERLKKQERAQRDKKRKMSEPPILPTAAERCVEGPIADLHKKRDKVYSLFEALNQVELVEEDGGILGTKRQGSSSASAVMPAQASKYAVDDAPALTSSQMAAQRKAKAAAKLAAEAEYDYSEEYYSDEEEADVVPEGSTLDFHSDLALLPGDSLPGTAAEATSEGGGGVDEQTDGQTDGKPETPPLDAPAEPTEAWPAVSAQGVGADKTGDRKNRRKKRADATQELSDADRATLGDDGVVRTVSRPNPVPDAPGVPSGAGLVENPPQPAVRQQALVAVVHAEACEVCLAAGAVPVDSGVCRICGGKRKKMCVDLSYAFASAQC